MMRILGIDVDSVSITPDVVAQILTDAHADGRLPHHWLLDSDSSVVEVAVGTVSQCWIGADLRSGIGRKPTVAHPVMAAAPISFNFRSSALLADTGICGVGVVNLAIIISSPVNRGSVPPQFTNSIRLDFSPTVDADISLSPLAPVPQDRIKAAILGYIKLVFSGTYPVPDEINALLAREGALHIATTHLPTPQLIIRQLQIERDVHGRRVFRTDPTIGVPFQNGQATNWCIVAEADRLGNIASRLVNKMQELNGNASTLRPENVSLSEGEIRITRHNATQQKLVRIRPGKVAGHQIPCDVLEGEPDAAIQATKVDLLELLRLRQPDGDKRSIATTQAISSRLIASLSHCSVKTSGIHFHGSLYRNAAAESPISHFDWYRRPNSVNSVTLYGMQSWSPASRITQASWDFGDGTTVESSGGQLALVVSHDYSLGGRFTCKLSVTDSVGRQAISSQFIDLSALRIQVGSPIINSDNTFTSMIRITCGNAPVENARLTIKRGDESDSEFVSDANGWIAFRSDSVAPYAISPSKRDPRDRYIGRVFQSEVTWQCNRREGGMIFLDQATYRQVCEAKQACSRATLVSQHLPATQRETANSLLLETRRALQAGILPRWFTSDAMQLSRQNVGTLQSLRQYIDELLITRLSL